MTKKLETQLIETPFYLAQDTEGALQWYAEDPLRSKNRESAKIDISKVLVDQFGRPDIGNPIVIKIRGALMERCRQFDVGIPERIRGGLVAHLEDFEGTCVEIVERPSTNKDFPFVGLMLDSEGRAAGYRLYSRTGICQDGNEDHRLIVIDEPMPRREMEE